MPFSEERVTLTIYLEAKENPDSDELDKRTRFLMRELEEFPIEPVSVLGENAPRPGSKGGDPLTWGALAVIVIQTALPKLLEFIQAWSLRDQSHVVKVKAQYKDRSIEMEYPQSMPQEDVKEYIKMVMDELRIEGKKALK